MFEEEQVLDTEVQRSQTVKPKADGGSQRRSVLYDKFDRILGYRDIVT